MDIKNIKKFDIKDLDDWGKGISFVKEVFLRKRIELNILDEGEWKEKPILTCNKRIIALFPSQKIPSHWDEYYYPMNECKISIGQLRKVLEIMERDEYSRINIRVPKKGEVFPFIITSDDSEIMILLSPMVSED